ncbi:hypothetical protein C0J52_23478 [Blattella germanica]|nr:hypothetical protein C0J52_23478 [Blattella germanica]
MNLDIVILAETKKKGTGQELIGDHLHVWSGVQNQLRAQSGVSILIKNKWRKCITELECINDRIIKLALSIFGQQTEIVGVYAINDDELVEKKEAFFETLSEVLEKGNPNHEVILIGDLNSRVGKDEEDVVGRLGEDTKNDNGDRLINLFREHECIIANTIFQHKCIHKYTWENPTRGLKSIIDLIVVKKNRRMVVQDVRVYRQHECGSDHHMVVGKFIFIGQRKRSTAKGNIDEKLEEIEETIYKRQTY